MTQETPLRPVYCLVLTGTRSFMGSEWEHLVEMNKIIHCSTSKEQLVKLQTKLQPELDVWNAEQTPVYSGEIPELSLEIQEFDDEEPESLAEFF